MWTEEGLTQFRRYQEQIIKAEMAAALELIGRHPRIGKRVKVQGGEDVHRVVLRRSAFLVYYVLQENRPAIISVWPGRASSRPLEG